MKNKLATCFALLGLLGFFFIPTSTIAQTPPTPEAPEPPSDDLDREGQGFPDGAWRGSNGLIYMSKSAESLNPENQAPSTTGGPDEFGYTWDDSVALDWIEGTIDTGLSGFNVWTGPLSIGFPFNFYENAYSDLYISSGGYISFDDDHLWVDQPTGGPGWPALPSIELPNNVIAPYWAPINIVPPTSHVYIRSGGSAPNRWFVVEWDRVRGASGDDVMFTFEVIIFENGDIRFQYKDMQYLGGFYGCGCSGIEDIHGFDGLSVLNFCDPAPSNKAVHLFRPEPAARVKVYPLYYSGFTPKSGTSPFEVPIFNSGDRAPDTYDLSVSSRWPVSLFESNGETPLIDTDGDGQIDTGSILPGENTSIIAKIKAPKSATIGAENFAAITATSSLNSSKSKTATLQTAIPAPFVQVFRDDADGAMSLYRVSPLEQVVMKATEDNYFGDIMAIAETAGGFVYTWHKGYPAGSISTTDLEFILLDHLGEVQRPVTKITDNSAAQMETYDYGPSIAVAPNGVIGLLWTRVLHNLNDQSNYNLFFAMLNSNGNLLHDPVNLTNNDIWNTYLEIGRLYYYYPRITATSDNRFVLAWQRSQSHDISPYMDDVYFAIRDTSGEEVKAPTNFTNNIAGASGSDVPSLTTLSGNRILLEYAAYTGDSHDSQYSKVTYAVIDSFGNVLKEETSTGDFDSHCTTDAAQLSDGRIVLAWCNRLIVLDGSTYDIVAGPTWVTVPESSPARPTYVSVTTDRAGHAILTWMDDYLYGNTPNLSYALINGYGEIITQPLIFHTAKKLDSGHYYLESSAKGYGNTSYNWFSDSFLYFLDTFLPLVNR